MYTFISVGDPVKSRVDRFSYPIIARVFGHDGFREHCDVIGQKVIVERALEVVTFRRHGINRFVKQHVSKRVFFALEQILAVLFRIADSRCEQFSDRAIFADRFIYYCKESIVCEQIQKRTRHRRNRAADDKFDRRRRFHEPFEIELDRADRSAEPAARQRDYPVGHGLKRGDMRRYRFETVDNCRHFERFAVLRDRAERAHRIQLLHFFDNRFKSLSDSCFRFDVIGEYRVCQIACFGYVRAFIRADRRHFTVKNVAQQIFDVRNFFLRRRIVRRRTPDFAKLAYELGYFDIFTLFDERSDRRVGIEFRERVEHRRDNRFRSAADLERKERALRKVCDDRYFGIAVKFDSFLNIAFRHVLRKVGNRIDGVVRHLFRGLRNVCDVSDIVVDSDRLGLFDEFFQNGGFVKISALADNRRENASRFLVFDEFRDEIVNVERERSDERVLIKPEIAERSGEQIVDDDRGTLDFGFTFGCRRDYNVGNDRDEFVYLNIFRRRSEVAENLFSVKSRKPVKRGVRNLFRLTFGNKYVCNVLNVADEFFDRQILIESAVTYRSGNKVARKFRGRGYCASYLFVTFGNSLEHYGVDRENKISHVDVERRLLEFLDSANAVQQRNLVRRRVSYISDCTLGDKLANERIYVLDEFLDFGSFVDPDARKSSFEQIVDDERRLVDDGFAFGSGDLNYIGNVTDNAFERDVLARRSEVAENLFSVKSRKPVERGVRNLFRLAFGNKYVRNILNVADEFFDRQILIESAIGNLTGYEISRKFRNAIYNAFDFILVVGYRFERYIPDGKHDFSHVDVERRLFEFLDSANAVQSRVFFDRLAENPLKVALGNEIRNERIRILDKFSDFRRFVNLDAALDVAFEQVVDDNGRFVYSRFAFGEDKSDDFADRVDEAFELNGGRIYFRILKRSVEHVARNILNRGSDSVDVALISRFLRDKAGERPRNADVIVHVFGEQFVAAAVNVFDKSRNRSRQKIGNRAVCLRFPDVSAVAFVVGYVRKFFDGFAEPGHDYVGKVAEHDFFEHRVGIERVVLVEEPARNVRELTIEEFGNFDGKIFLFAVVFFVISAVFVIVLEAHKRGEYFADAGFGQQRIYDFFHRIVGRKDVEYVIE